MGRIKSYTLVLSTALALALLGCGRSSAEARPEPGSTSSTRESRDSKSDKEARAAAVRADPPPPDDYVRSRCTVCSCRVFTGGTGICSRPSCGHGWKDHQSKLAKD
jgi:hypothetical protein